MTCAVMVDDGGLAKRLALTSVWKVPHTVSQVTGMVCLVRSSVLPGACGMTDVDQALVSG